MSTKELMLSTIDNPFDPFTEFDEWYQYDVRNGHHSLSLLARVAKVYEGITDEHLNDAINDAIKEIVGENVSGIHVAKEK